MKLNPMQDALGNRTAKGLDLTIILNGETVMGGDDEEQEQKELGLAPDAEELNDGAEPQAPQTADPAGKMVIGDEMRKHGLLGKNSIAGKIGRK